MAGLDKPKILVVCGPTASGKSALALHLSRVLGGEMVGADSMQIYTGLVVGTAAVTETEAEGIPQHMTGFLPPQCAYSVAEYLQDAGRAVDGILVRGALPVVCGGTGLYISALVEGLRFAEEPDSVALRGELEEKWRADEGAALRKQLEAVDPAAFSRLHPNDAKRNIRALESFLATGKTAAEREAASKPADAPYNALVLALDFPDRNELYSRINLRVEQMLQNGLLDEARLVYNNRDSYKTAAQAIGYKELFPFLEGRASLTECTQKLQQATRNYAKRQLTWFRRMQGVQWLDASSPALFAEAEHLVREFLH